VTQLPIPPPPPSKAKEHWQRGKQRLTKLFAVLKKLYSGLGAFGDQWEKTSKRLNRNFDEMYSDASATEYPSWWSDESTSVRRKKKKRKPK
jgi:hypothetical protein